jgi:uncharacterized protein YfcZ (UPF0381/DUF406 family)
MDAQALASALTLPNTTFVYVADAETAIDVENIIDVENMTINTGAFGATEAGNAYIAEQILAALTLDCAHAYDNACDATCNIYAAERTVGAHTFGEWAVVTEPTTEAEGLQERVCTICGYKESEVIAKLDKPVDPVDPPVEPPVDPNPPVDPKPVDPKPQPQPQPEEPAGLSTGAVVAIVISSTLVAGVGGFAIFWFVVKKKGFAELVAAFKK